MPIIYEILSEIALADQGDSMMLSSLRLKLARTMAVELSVYIAQVDREYAAKYVEIKNCKRDSGFKATVDELTEARNETEIAQKRTELTRLWKGCEETLRALQQRVHVIEELNNVCTIGETIL